MSAPASEQDGTGKTLPPVRNRNTDNEVVVLSLCYLSFTSICSGCRAASTQWGQFFAIEERNLFRTIESRYCGGSITAQHQRHWRGWLKGSLAGGKTNFFLRCATFRYVCNNDAPCRQAKWGNKCSGFAVENKLVTGLTNIIS